MNVDKLNTNLWEDNDISVCDNVIKDQISQEPNMSYGISRKGLYQQTWVAEKTASGSTLFSPTELSLRPNA